MEAQLALPGWLQPVRRPESRPEATLEGFFEVREQRAKGVS